MGDTQQNTTQDTMDDVQNPKQQINFGELLKDDSFKSALNAYVEEQVRPLKTAYESEKRDKQRYQIAKNDKGEPIYADPDEVRRYYESKKSGTPQDQQKTGISDDDVRRAQEVKEREIMEKIVRPKDEQLSRFQQTLRNVLINDRLKSELFTAGVDAAMIDAAVLLLERHLEVADLETNPIVIVKDDQGKTDFGGTGRKTLKEFVDDWKKTDTGKRFIVAPMNTGGGAGSGNKTTTDYVIRGQKILNKQQLQGSANRKIFGDFVAQYGGEAYERLPEK